MAFYILFMAAVTPVLGLGYFIYKKDVHKEPNKLLFKIFGFGFLSAIPVAFIEQILDSMISMDDAPNFIALFISVFVVVGIVEEGFKWIVAKNVGYENKEFDEIYDIIVYSVFASLGFACIENIIYVFNHGLVTALLRALLSIPGHTCFGVLMGYYFSQAKINSINHNKSLYNKNMIFSLLVPAFFHTVYDAILMYGQNFEELSSIIWFIVFDITMVILCFKIVSKTSKIQQSLDIGVQQGEIKNTDRGIEYHGEVKSMNYCPLCGTFVQGSNFCTGCGFKLK